jgi:hypothetical protein
MPPRAKTTKNSDGEGKRYPLSMRTTFELRRKLEQAAKRSGLSLAQELERRLEYSFSAEKNHADALQAEYEMREQAENELERARDRIDQLENLLANNAVDIQTAIEKAFAKAGLLKPDGTQL